MRRSILLVTFLMLVAALAAGLVACSGGSTSPTPSASPPASAGGVPVEPAAGTKLAPGLYDREDGSVVAVGTVEHRDLEGGFWAVIGGTQAEGDAGRSSPSSPTATSSPQVFRENKGLSFEVYGHESRRRVDQDGRSGDHARGVSCWRPRQGRRSSRTSRTAGAGERGTAGRRRRPGFAVQISVAAACSRATL